eukprot:EG_transcript_17707
MAAPAAAAAPEPREEVLFHGSPVPITCAAAYRPPHAAAVLRAVAESFLLRAWLSRLEANPHFVLTSVQVQDVDLVAQEVLWVQLQAEAVNEAGLVLPVATLLRGPAASVLAVVRGPEGPFALLMRRCRPAVGLPHSLELPTGLYDGQGAFCGRAANEIAAVFGDALALGKSNARDLMKVAAENGSTHRRNLLTNPAASDESLSLHLVQLDVDTEKWSHMRSASEAATTLDLLPLNQVWRATSDAKTLAALLLYANAAAAVG